MNESKSRGGETNLESVTEIQARYGSNLKVLQMGPNEHHLISIFLR